MSISSTTSTISRRRMHLAVSLLASVAAISTSGPAGAAESDPPGWEVCTYSGHPAAADLGAILPVTFVPDAQTRSVLHGQVASGTDCSFYDLPV